MDRAPILLHGATGFTGRLVARRLLDNGVPFAVSGRDAAKLAKVAEDFGAREVCAFSVEDDEAVKDAVAGRTLVAACAGPFVHVGEPVARACAEAGVHYVDTTGEQAFVARLHRELAATAKASGACLVPAMGFEMAPSDWAAHLAAAAVGGRPDEIALLYAPDLAREGGLRVMTSAGTRKSILAAIGSAETWQWQDGALVREPAAEIVRSFLVDGRSVRAISAPMGEAFVTPAHTGARTLRTFLVSDVVAAELAHLTRHVTPSLLRTFGPTLGKRFVAGIVGPEGEARRVPFVIVAEAIRRRPARDGGDLFARVTVHGSDPYGFTARAITYAALAAIRGHIRVAGLVAPSVAFPPVAAMEALGLTATTDVIDPGE